MNAEEQSRLDSIVRQLACRGGYFRGVGAAIGE